MLALGLPLVTPAPAQAARQPKIVYLTFDDGPNAMNSPRLLKLLAREHVPATFFLVGQSLAADPEHAVRLWLGGHAVGNHTYSHSNLTLLSPASVRHQILAAQKLMGPGAGKCLRPPYGATNSTVTAVAGSLGIKQVLWTVDPQDWAHQDATYIASHVLSNVRNKSVVLLHDGGGPRGATISAVRVIILALRAQGYEFRTIPACRVPFGGSLIEAAQPRRKPAKPTPSPTLPQPPVTPALKQTGIHDG